jgi:hypothetical protein
MADDFAEVPDVLREALGLSASVATKIEQAEEFNPWIDNPKRKRYVPEDSDEMDFAVVEKLLAPEVTPTKRVPYRSDPFRPEPFYTPLEHFSAEDRAYNENPLAKLFAEDFAFTSAPLEKRAAPVTRENLPPTPEKDAPLQKRDESCTQEQLDRITKIILSAPEWADDESEAAYDERVARLVEPYL